MHENRGITLVALVITIVVLLILAVISIVSLTENGLFERVKVSKERSDASQVKENNTITEYVNMIGNHMVSIETTRDTINSFITLTGTSPSKVNTWEEVVPYPEGFDKTNVHIVSAILMDEYLLPYYDSNVYMVLGIGDNGIIMKSNYSRILSQPIRIIITKMNGK